ncbi:lysozyme inhibitor LprI family protein [Pseudomonas leptonychotis]|uniref:lysozyme inhibitor LprI family protein n=1 Tax=Pseudomonas leptonychotis TaxID=2448482 RepID=UPI0039EF0558
MNFPPLLLGIALLVLHSTLLAAGMNCQLASTASEQAICTSPNLHPLDVRMGELYSNLAKGYPQELTALRQVQRAWLKKRDRCLEAQDCLTQMYTDRLAALHTQLRNYLVYRPDEIDRLALEDLRLAVEQAGRTNAEFPLESALERLLIKSVRTQFHNIRDDHEAYLDPALFPKQRPDGVSLDEWQALLASDVETIGENGNTSYTLVDLNGDGLRDLVIDTYYGGTGLFSYIGTLQRKGDRFISNQMVNHNSHSEDDPPGYLYSLNGRGANQTDYWIELRGRRYAAYRVGYYGVDYLYLLHPLAPIGEVPTLTLKYRYQLSIPKVQADDATATHTELSEIHHVALNQVLSVVEAKQANNPIGQESPLCPIPAGASEEQHGDYYGFGPGHYTYEIVADMAVILDGHCHVGRLANWFGSYSAEHGLHAQLWIKRPGSDNEGQYYQVQGQRQVISISTSIGRAEGDNGF